MLMIFRPRSSVHALLFFAVGMFVAACSQPETSSQSDAVVDARTARIAEMVDEWPEMPVLTDTYNALDPNLGAATATTRIKFDPADDYWGLPRTEGYDLVDAYCSACHTLQIVMQQSATTERWDYMLEWMVREQGMPPMIEEDRELVLNYLSQTFGTNAD